MVENFPPGLKRSEYRRLERQQRRLKSGHPPQVPQISDIIPDAQSIIVVRPEYLEQIAPELHPYIYLDFESQEAICSRYSGRTTMID